MCIQKQHITRWTQSSVVVFYLWSFPATFIAITIENDKKASYLTFLICTSSLFSVKWMAANVCTLERYQLNFSLTAGEHWPFHLTKAYFKNLTSHTSTTTVWWFSESNWTISAHSVRLTSWLPQRQWGVAVLSNLHPSALSWGQVN